MSATIRVSLISGQSVMAIIDGLKWTVVDDDKEFPILPFLERRVEFFMLDLFGYDPQPDITIAREAIRIFGGTMLKEEPNLRPKFRNGVEVIY